MSKALAADLEPEIPQEEIAAAEQPAVKEEPKAEEKPPEEEKKDPSERNVPHGAFHEERERRKKAEQEAAQLRQQQAVLADRYQQLFQTVNQKPEPEIPPEEVDPLANHRARLAQTEQQQKQILEELQRRQQYEHQQRQEQAFRAHVSGLEAQFVKEKPDYHEALNFIRARRVQELEAAGYVPQQIAQILDQHAVQIAWDAVQRGQNPAEVIYAMAERTGYAKKAPQIPAEQKMEALQKGTAAAKTLGSGAAQAGPPTPEQIAEMSDEDFAAFKAELAKKGKRLSDVL